jgi:hypothetical protein
MCSKDHILKLDETEQKLCEPYLDVQTFLNYVALDDFTQFCLGYALTARDFADGTLGLAWVAKTSGSIGGICERRFGASPVRLRHGSKFLNIFQANGAGLQQESQ